MKRQFSVRLLVNAYATVAADTPEDAAELARFLDPSTCSFDDYIDPSDVTVGDEIIPA